MKAIIEKHPLRDTYMLWLQGSSIPPYFGSEQECKKARIHLCKKINDDALALCRSRYIEPHEAKELVEFVNNSLDVINENRLIDALIGYGYNIKYTINGGGVITEYELTNVK